MVAVWWGVALLAAGCVMVPVAVAVLVSPWLGLLLSVGSFWVWARLGPRPFPGFLPGIICLWGFAAITGTFIGCAALAVRSLMGEPGHVSPSGDS